MESKKYSRNSENGTSYDRNRSVSRRRDGSFMHSQGDKRRFSPDIGWNRGSQKRNVENIRDHGDRIWRDESQRFHQVPNFMLDRHADLDCCDVDQRQNGLSNEMGISAREMCQDRPGSDPNLSMNSYPNGVLSGPSMMTEFSPMMNGTIPNLFLPHCVLVPPPPLNAREASRIRDRPPGCRAVFVFGLDENVNNEIIREVFSHCGEISRVRMSRKGFCDIEFEREEVVEQALMLSGYRLIVKFRNGGRSVGCRIHVDYAVPRDDGRDYDFMMCALQREECHRTPFPQPVQCYSDQAAASLVKSLQGKDTFEKGCMVLMTWLERGDCSKKNCKKFYNLLDSVYRYVQKLVDEKTIIEDDLTTVQQQPHQQCACNARQFQVVEKVFHIVSSQKVWANFTKLQKKHIELWKELVILAKQQNSDDLLEDRIEDEMEMSDSKIQNSPEDCAQDLVTLNENSNKVDKPDLEKETEVLHNQLEVANSELAESKKQIASLNDAYQLMQQKYLDTKLKLEEVSKEKTALENAPGATTLTEHEARLVSLIAIFLNMQPLGGASIDYICSYLLQIDGDINTGEVENFMKKFSAVFKEESKGTGIFLKKKWIFCGFRSCAAHS